MTRERARIVIAALSGALAALAFCGVLMVNHASEDAAESAAAQAEADAEAEDVTVYDTPATMITPPLYYQADERWGGLPYATAESNVAESGCGLCAAASAAAFLTGKDYITPSYLLNLVGNSCIDGGVNHMGRFCEQLNAIWGIQYQDLWTLTDAEQYLIDGWGLLAGMSGSVYEGGREYGAHVLYIWGYDDQGVYIRDSADPLLQTPITWEQFESIEWGSYFYAIRSEQV